MLASWWPNSPGSPSFHTPSIKLTVRPFRSAVHSLPRRSDDGSEINRRKTIPAALFACYTVVIRVTAGHKIA